jgi:Zn finger protein HypA/HybF involved in hydrogenase expression
MPLPRSLAHLKREISEKKWVEARQWAARFYQLKTGHCLTGQYLHWTKNRPSAQCWWCRYRTQTRNHLFKVCPEWKAQ